MTSLRQNFFAILFLITFPSFAIEPDRKLPTATEYLEMGLDQSLPLIESLSKEETKELITTLRQEAKQSYPKIDHFYFLISHLEEVSAIEKEQARLKSLLWVFGLAFILFNGFLAFLLFRQRKAVSDINHILKSD